MPSLSVEGTHCLPLGILIAPPLKQSVLALSVICTTACSSDVEDETDVLSLGLVLTNLVTIHAIKTGCIGCYATLSLRPTGIR